ncbi:MAG: 4Fe-4S dicluster domain-containing protein [Bacteroidales bacterium]|nr:4Fe-4S dicluster domain-containing protein [Bacteroidales bacterium]
MHHLIINKDEWDKALEKLLLSYTIFTPADNEFGQDYELLRPEDVSRIIYNKPKPSTPLKTFFLPLKENVTSEPRHEKQRIIMGIPNCDIEGLGLPEEMYLNGEFDDVFFQRRRENTILIASDCLGIQEHCHCLSYGISPYTAGKADLALILLEDKMVIRVITGKGEDLLKDVNHLMPLTDNSILESIERKHQITGDLLKEKNKGLPDYATTGRLVKESGPAIWKKYSASCVSCGACTLICPTCTCFLLIDKPGFEKIRQTDACQYPGFQRVAGGEDELHELHKRFRNRYMCKYVWKPERFRSIACTGCGRCIEACIGRISKNELFMELV